MLFVFHPRGENIPSQGIAPGELWLGVGNRIDYQAIHHTAGYENNDNQFVSTAEIVLNRPDLLFSRQSRIPGEIHMCLYPNLDSCIAAFLALEYINKGSFPEQAPVLVNLAQKVNLASLKIIANNNIYSMHAGIVSQFEEDKENSNLTSRERYLEGTAHSQEILSRNLTLISLTLAKLAENPFFSLESDEFFPNEFEDVYHFMENDYARYEEDKRTICDIKRIRLPRKNDLHIENEGVLALIWQKPSTSSFNRIWARDEGFILTAIPSKTAHNGETEFRTYNGSAYPIINIHISLPEELKDTYTLRPLAAYLEACEQAREQEILGNYASRKRDRSRTRTGFSDEPFWKTGDPWFSGYNDTLISAPTSGSLLSYDEIILELERFTSSTVINSSMKLVFPFNFETLYHNEMNKSIFQADWLPTSLDKVLVSSGVSKEEFLSDHYLCTTTREFWLNDELKCWSHRGLTLDINHDVKVNISHLLIFTTGVGFLISDYPLASYSGMLSTEAIRQLKQKQLDSLEGRLDTVMNLIPQNENFKVNIANPIFYTSLQLGSQYISIPDATMEDTAFLLCDPFGDTLLAMENAIIGERRAVVWTGYGCAQVSAINAETDLANNAFVSRQERNRRYFSQEWFLLFLLAQYQRSMLNGVKEKLLSLSLNDHNKIRDLSDVLTAFWAKGYFSQASQDDHGQAFFRLGQNVLEVQQLKDEINAELESVHDYNESQMNDWIQKVSEITIPFVVLATLSEASFIKLRPILSFEDPTMLKYDLEAVFIWLFVLLLFFLLSRMIFKVLRKVR